MNRLIMLGCLFGSVIAMADVVVPVKDVKNFVNVRAEARSDAEVVGRLRKNTPLPLIAAGDEWNEVRLDSGETGFVSANWSDVIAEPDAADDAAPAHESALPEETPVTANAAEPDVDSEMAAESGSIEPVTADTAEDRKGDTEPVAPTPPQPVAVAMQPDEAEPTGMGDDTETNAETASTDSPDRHAGASIAVMPMPAATVSAVVKGPKGDPGPSGPPGPAGSGSISGEVDFLVKFKAPTEGTSSQIFDNGNRVGIGTVEPTQRLEVNGNIQINEQNSSVAGLMITQSSGETGYIMHNRASTLTIGAGSVDRVTIDRDGNTGFGVARPEHPLEMRSGAHVTAGGVWTNSSSRALKNNIVPLDEAVALDALAGLAPVTFNYRSEQREDYVGFIAEDVPELVATRGRDSLSSMDIVAVLTRVVQSQQRRIEALEKQLLEQSR